MNAVSRPTVARLGLSCIRPRQIVENGVTLLTPWHLVAEKSHGWKAEIDLCRLHLDPRTGPNPSRVACIDLTTDLDPSIVVPSNGGFMRRSFKVVAKNDGLHNKHASVQGMAGGGGVWLH